MSFSYSGKTSISLPSIAKNTIKALALILAVSGLPLTSATNADAQTTTPTVKKVSKEQALRRYANSGYGYCDAKKVASVWNKNIGRAKIIIGRKIASNLTHLIDQDIASTAGRVNCSFQESGFDYNDAVRVSQIWNVGIGQAKDKIKYGTSQMGTKRFRAFANL